MPVEEYTKPRHRTRANQSFQILADIEPFVSPIDGRTITSRSKLREHNAEHGVVNFHEFDGHWEAKAKERQQIAEGTHGPTKRERTQDIVESIQKLEAGYKPQVEEVNEDGGIL